MEKIYDRNSKKNLYIFTNSISGSSNSKLIPFKARNHYLGEVKYSPPISKE